MQRKALYLLQYLLHLPFLTNIDTVLLSYSGNYGLVLCNCIKFVNFLK
jgi:hypothetical protein